jgi:hypothetical protein
MDLLSLGSLADLTLGLPWRGVRLPHGPVSYALELSFQSVPETTDRT